MSGPIVVIREKPVMPIAARPASVAQRLLPGPRLAAGLSARVAVAGCPGRAGGLGGHGAGGHGVCRHRWGAADHGPLHDRPAVDRLRAARDLRLLVVGPDTATGLISALTVGAIAVQGTAEFNTLTSTLAILIGAFFLSLA